MMLAIQKPELQNLVLMHGCLRRQGRISGSNRPIVLLTIMGLSSRVGYVRNRKPSRTLSARDDAVPRLCMCVGQLTSHNQVTGNDGSVAPVEAPWILAFEPSTYRSTHQHVLLIHRNCSTYRRTALAISLVLSSPF